MTVITYEGKPVLVLRIGQVGENLVSFTFEFEDGKKETIGYFREES